MSPYIVRYIYLFKYIDMCFNIFQSRPICRFTLFISSLYLCIWTMCFVAKLIRTMTALFARLVSSTLLLYFSLQGSTCMFSNWSRKLMYLHRIRCSMCQRVWNCVHSNLHHAYRRIALLIHITCIHQWFHIVMCVYIHRQHWGLKNMQASIDLCMIGPCHTKNTSWWPYSNQGLNVWSAIRCITEGMDVNIKPHMELLRHDWHCMCAQAIR